MTLASDAISHIALPGIGLAILLHVHPLLGGAAALLLGTLLVWTIEHKTRIPTEAIIGVVFFDRPGDRQFDHVRGRFDRRSLRLAGKAEQRRDRVWPGSRRPS